MHVRRQMHAKWGESVAHPDDLDLLALVREVVVVLYSHAVLLERRRVVEDSPAAGAPVTGGRVAAHTHPITASEIAPRPELSVCWTEGSDPGEHLIRLTRFSSALSAASWLCFFASSMAPASRAATTSAFEELENTSVPSVPSIGS